MTSDSINAPCLPNLPYPIDWDSKIPRVFVVCTSAQRQGFEHSSWIDAISELEINKNIQYILEKSPVPNSRLFKFSATQNFKGIDIEDSMPVPYIAQLGQGVLKHGTPFACYYRLLHENHNSSNILEAFTNKYRGAYPSAADFVREFASEKFAHLSVNEIVRALFDSEEKTYCQVPNRYENVVYIYKL